MEDIQLLNSYTEKDNSAAEGMTTAMRMEDSDGKSEKIAGAAGGDYPLPKIS